MARRNEPDAVPFTLVAFLGPVPVGCVSVCRDDRDADFDAEGPWLSGMFVLGSARDLGVGRALVRAAEERAAAMGHRELWLHTAEAHRFYERCGWRVARVRSALGRDAVMCRELAAPGSG
ncbi:MAG: GNAT family N-acetyltransferase [Acidimicrobiia bacterium]|nr:GNAT family N-acetyltransferase [Acidimicrobiia bacterium]